MIVDKNLADKVRTICKRLNITEALTWVNAHNSANELPYHNLYHTHCMVEKCVEGANYHNLPYRSIQNLVVAALFHDFAHSGGHKDDAVNINNAILGFNSYEDRVRSNIDANEVRQFIRITQYPYIEEPICIEQRIIRDADLMQSFRSTWKEMILDGLREEMSIKLKKELSLEEMAQGQVAFLKNVRPLSGWGKYVMLDCAQLDISIVNFSAYF